MPPACATHLLLVNRPRAVQSSIVLGNLSLPASDPRQYALIVGDRILGEGSDSRLMRAFHEKRLAPDAHSEVVRHQEVTHFLATSQVRQPTTDQALSQQQTWMPIDRVPMDVLNKIQYEAQGKVPPPG